MDVNELTYLINGTVFEVNRVLGPGFLEKVYENSMMVEFKKRDLKAQAQVPIEVKYKGEIVGEYFADIVVEDQIILELKAVESLQKIHEAQLLNYLNPNRSFGFLFFVCGWLCGSVANSTYLFCPCASVCVCG